MCIGPLYNVTSNRGNTGKSATGTGIGSSSQASRALIYSGGLCGLLIAHGRRRLCHSTGCLSVGKQAGNWLPNPCRPHFFPIFFFFLAALGAVCYFYSDYARQPTPGYIFPFKNVFLFSFAFLWQLISVFSAHTHTRKAWGRLRPK